MKTHNRAFQELGAEIFGKSIIVYPYIYPPLQARLFAALAFFAALLAFAKPRAEAAHA
jgi:hypothetical protein